MKTPVGNKVITIPSMFIPDIGELRKALEGQTSAIVESNGAVKIETSPRNHQYVVGVLEKMGLSQRTTRGVSRGWEKVFC